MSLPPPKLSADARERMLEPPGHPVRLVIDTDTANEIDDQFALAWAFLSPEALEIEAIYAEPYSFGIYRDDLRETRRRLDEGLELHARLAPLAGWVRGLEAAGRHPADLAFTTPEEGMEASYHEVFAVAEKMDIDVSGRVFRGAPRYMRAPDDVVESEAVDHLIALAMRDDERPLHVAAIGCPTNVASAIVKEPAIRERIVVSWTAAYPSTANRPNYSFNLDQDFVASRLLFDSGVPLVYLPGFHVGAQLTLSLPEVERWVRGRGEIGDYLHHLYTHNPLHEQRGIDGHFGRTWTIWDLINFAWLIDPSWVPTALVPTPRLDDGHRWRPRESGAQPMREAHGIDRDAIFRDFLGKLEAAYGA